jgi:hypothetical protein
MVKKLAEARLLPAYSLNFDRPILCWGGPTNAWSKARSSLLISLQEVFVVIAKANVSVDMGPDSTSFDPPSLPLVYAAPPTSGQIDVVVSGRLQRYFGSFVYFSGGDLLNPFASVFTGYQQFDGLTDSSPLQYEISGAAVSGVIVVACFLSGNTGALLDQVFNGADQLDGSTGADTLNGFAGDDSIRGGAGADVLVGDDGSDFVNGNDGADTITGGLGNDTLRGGKGADLIWGEWENDQLYGDLGDDALYGGVGDDTLNGNQGNDTLEGGQGADRFVLSRDFDVIRDFNAEDGDRIAVLSSTLPYELVDSAEGLQIIRDGVGITTLIGVTAAGFDAAASIVVI